MWYNVLGAWLAIVIIAAIIVKIVPFMEYIFTWAGMAAIIVIVVSLTLFNIGAGIALMWVGTASVLRGKARRP